MPNQHNHDPEAVKICGPTNFCPSAGFFLTSFEFKWNRNFNEDQLFPWCTYIGIDNVADGVDQEFCKCFACAARVSWQGSSTFDLKEKPALLEKEVWVGRKQTFPDASAPSVEIPRPRIFNSYKISWALCCSKGKLGCLENEMILDIGIMNYWITGWGIRYWGYLDIEGVRRAG